MYAPAMIRAIFRGAVLCAFALVAGAHAPAATSTTLQHLVYRFGYNGPANDQGNQTGTTTVDVVGPASDGGVNVSMLDAWWNQSRPRQQYTCELYPTGSVKCATAPFAMSPIQATLLPLLARSYFSALASNANANWNMNYTVRATFLPQASGGFAGQVYTWNCAYALTGHGTVPSDAPNLLIYRDGTMTQQGGRLVKLGSKTKIAFDPRIHVPIVVGEEITVISPKVTTNRYVINLRLIRTGPN